MLLSIVIPIYKSSSTIIELHKRLVKQSQMIGCEVEIIFVNDCSPDNSWDIISKLSLEKTNIKALNFSRNFGQHAAIAAGINIATGDWLVVMDADLQDRPEEIPKLLSVAQSKNIDIALGQRMVRNDTFLKKLSSKLFYYVFTLVVGMKVDHSIGNFGVYSKRVYTQLQNFSEKNRFFPTDIQWLGFPQETVEISHGKREQGKSSYNLSKLITLAFFTITTRTNRPLYFAIFLGAFISGTSFLLGILIVFKGLFYEAYTVSGWASLIVSTFFLSGTIFFAIGILGIYIGHIYSESKSRALYIVKDII